MEKIRKLLHEGFTIIWTFALIFFVIWAVATLLVNMAAFLPTIHMSEQSE